jgi:hypothetical protein
MTPTVTSASAAPSPPSLPASADGAHADITRAAESAAMPRPSFFETRMRLPFVFGRGFMKPDSGYKIKVGVVSQIVKLAGFL